MPPTTNTKLREVITTKSTNVSVQYFVSFQCEFGSGGGHTFKMPIVLRGPLGKGLYNFLY